MCVYIPTHMYAHVHSCTCIYIHINICPYVYIHKLGRGSNPQNTIARNRTEPRNVVSWQMQILLCKRSYKGHEQPCKLEGVILHNFTVQTGRDESLLTPGGNRELQVPNGLPPEPRGIECVPPTPRAGRSFSSCEWRKHRASDRNYKEQGRHPEDVEEKHAAEHDLIYKPEGRFRKLQSGQWQKREWPLWFLPGRRTESSMGTVRAETKRPQDPGR